MKGYKSFFQINDGSGWDKGQKNKPQSTGVITNYCNFIMHGNIFG